MTIYTLGTLIILLPLLIIAWFSFGKLKSKTEWLLRLLFVGSMVLVFYKIGTWSMTSYYMRFVIVVLFLGSAFYSFYNIRTGFWHIPKKQWFRMGGTALFTLLGILLSALTYSGTSYSGSDMINLKFPFGQGRYYVLQGGSNVMTNPFHSMALNGKYAIDLVEINNLGNRAATILPQELAQYHIFGEVVYSPCNGRVVTTVNGFPDNIPTNVDREHPAGNHVVIECDSIKVMLAHLKAGSLKVSQGDNVKAGWPVAEVGNSGYTDEPHLHIQANSHDGNPVAILFGERFLSINDVYVVN
ncbi:M23 family metallopeptidase [Sulfuriflexus mobilis]|uniref:M23 family metallopeptidase n=1 Tax=Sulfuriflexus mobilis TaxID=1811807 RepID=UPI000F82214C|nr:M23 family metallopeptidase [Sulfuriflexus mobilis]